METDNHNDLLSQLKNLGDSLIQEQKKSTQLQTEYKAGFEFMPMVAVIVNKDRRITVATYKTLEELQKPLEQVFGERGGNVFNCIHHEDSSLGCGYGKACCACGVKNTVLKALNQKKELSEVKTKLTVKRGEKIIELSLLVHARNVEIFGDPRVALYIAVEHAKEIN